LSNQIIDYAWIKGTAFPAERCDLVGVKLDFVHFVQELSQVCEKGGTIKYMAQFCNRSRPNVHGIFNLHKFINFNFGRHKKYQITMTMLLYCRDGVKSHHSKGDCVPLIGVFTTHFI
jgi:hypothetical protein